MDQPGKVANHARGQLNRGKICFPVHVRLVIWSLKTGSLSPSRVSPLLFSTGRLNLVLTHGIPPVFSDSVHFYREGPSGRSRVYRVRQLRTYWRSLPRVSRHTVSSTRAAFSGFSKYEVFCVSLSPHTHHDWNIIYV